MERLEDDVCSFGFILLESLIGPSVSAGRDKFLLDELVGAETLELKQDISATCTNSSH